MKDETKKAIASASDALDTISCKISTVSALAALALSEVVCRHPEMDTVETLLNAVIDALSYQSSEVLHWSIELDHIGGSENK